jgi:hypothetical protein
MSMSADDDDMTWQTRPTNQCGGGANSRFLVGTCESTKSDHPIHVPPRAMMK